MKILWMLSAGLVSLSCLAQEAPDRYSRLGMFVGGGKELSEEVCFFDLNGCQNDGMYGTPPFNAQFGDLIPFSTDAISALIKKLGAEAPDCEVIFKQFYKKYRHLNPPISEEKAWQKIQKQVEAARVAAELAARGNQASPKRYALAGAAGGDQPADKGGTADE